MLRYKVNLSRDITVGSVLPPLLNVHAFLAPPAPPILAAPAVEYPLPNFWPPGAAFGQNKLTKRITHQGAALVQDGHDVGIGIPHISIPVFNTLTPLHMLFSKRRAAFFEPSVRFERAFAAPCGLASMPPTPMFSCNEPVSMPIAAVVTDALRTVEFGMTWSTWLVSFGLAAATLALDLIQHAATGTPGHGPHMTTMVAKDFFKEVGEKILGGSTARSALIKAGVSAGLGLSKETADGTKTLSVSSGGPFLKVGVRENLSGDRSIDWNVMGISDESNAWSDAADRSMDYDNWGTDLEDSDDT